jgi:hypothetical protein
MNTSASTTVVHMSDQLTPAPPEDPQSPEAYQRVLDMKSDYAVMDEIVDVSNQIAHLEALRLYAIKELSTRTSMGALDGCRHDENADAGDGTMGDDVTSPDLSRTSVDGDPVATSPEHAARLAELDRLADQAEHEARGYSRLNTIDLLEAELTAALHISNSEATKLITMSLALTSRLPGTMTALFEGRLDLRRAQLIHDQATPMGEDAYELALKEGKTPAEAEQAARDLLARLEAHILKRAPGQSPKPLIKALSRAVKRLDPGYENDNFIWPHCDRLIWPHPGQVGAHRGPWVVTRCDGGGGWLAGGLGSSGGGFGCSGGAEAVGVGAGLDDVGSEGEAVDDGGGQAGVGEGCAPFGERGIGSASDGSFFLAGGDDLEQQFGAAGVEVDVADLVEAEQVEAGVATDDA